ncbi:MAG: CarD family transcriptional regulator [Ruminiclostridium sp.]|nr:CarD family transcriptional regulator [Ruminiclostridium sp.]
MAEAYSIGDYVSYSSSGVCRIEDIRQEPPAGKEAPKTFYILKPLADPASTIFVPTASPVLLAKMKRLPNKEEADSMILTAKERQMPWIDDRKLRAAAFQTITKNCDLKELLDLVICIYQKQRMLTAQGKKLTASDESTLRRAEVLIENELSFVLDLKKDQVGAYIREKLSI